MGLIRINCTNLLLSHRAENGTDLKNKTKARWVCNKEWNGITFSDQFLFHLIWIQLGRGPFSIRSRRRKIIFLFFNVIYHLCRSDYFLWKTRHSFGVRCAREFPKLFYSFTLWFSIRIHKLEVIYCGYIINLELSMAIMIVGFWFWNGSLAESWKKNRKQMSGYFFSIKISHFQQ